MCGIIGYVGSGSALPVLMQGLATLEYRGYDSAGVAVLTGTARPELRVVKRAGKLAVLDAALADIGVHGQVGLGHTRWATHGPPTDRNAHPHVDGAGNLALVHNGIIENYAEIKEELRAAGVEFLSDTDTEVLAALLARAWRPPAQGAAPGAGLAGALREVMGRIDGQFAVAVVDRREPGVLVTARRGAPLVLGHADGAMLLSSDVAGLIAHTRDVEALEDDQIAVLTADGAAISDVTGAATSGRRYTVDWDIDAAEKQGYPHFMLKEIHEQPQAITDTLLGRLDDRGRIALDELRFEPAELRTVDKVYIVAAGTSYHAGLVAKHAIEHWAGIGVEVEIASEFRYRDPILTPHTLVVAISQSGETTDTIAAAAHARDQRAKVVAISNVVGSTLTREADAVVYTRAGPEIAVASTKAFTTQIVALGVLALFCAQERRTLFAEECRDQLARYEELPGHVAELLAVNAEELAALAGRLADAGYVMFIGRHNGVPIALEGALKLKEISYLHAEGFPAGEMKHGPIALIDVGGPVVAIATRGHVHGKVVSNIQEVKARGAEVIAIATAGDTAVKAHADHVLYVPAVHELLTPVLTVVPLQVLAYHTAVALGRDVDQPRNLAKTVTVE